MSSQAIVSPGRSGAVSAPMFLLIAVFVLIWTSAFSVAKLAIADCPPLLLLSTRFLVAGALMLGVAAAGRASWTLKRRDVLMFALLGIANQAIYLGVGYVGLLSISSGLSVLIFSCNPSRLRPRKKERREHAASRRDRWGGPNQPTLHFALSTR